MSASATLAPREPARDAHRIRKDRHLVTADWQSNLPEFHATAADTIVGSLEDFVRDFSPQQSAAWREGVPFLCG